MAAQQPARTSPELRARLHSARANVGITPRPGALPDFVHLAYEYGHIIPHQLPKFVRLIQPTNTNGI